MSRRMHLGAHFPGVNNTTLWGRPDAGSHIAFDGFRHLAQVAERATFDFFFLAEGLSLREHAGRIHDLDVAGRPDGLAVLSALAAVTEHLGLVATVTTTYHDPHEAARQFATLDHLSSGRAGWNLVTSSDAPTGRNFRRGAYLPYAERYVRGREFLEAADALWASWPAGEPVADARGGVFTRAPDPGAVAYQGRWVALDGRFTVPASPQGRPVLLQAGDSADGRAFAAAHADAVFTAHGSLEDGRAFSADVRTRAARHGRDPDALLVLPAATFVLADTDAEAHELAAIVRREQVSGPTAMVVLEQLWNRDLSAYDADGPLPDVDPVEGEITIAPGSIRARAFAGRRREVADAWRARAAAEGLSIRDLMVELSARQTFVGSPETMARELIEHVDARACDGFILVPHLTPGGLDDFAARVVPLLKERGAMAPEYAGGTLRENLGLPAPARASRRAAG